MSETKPCRNGHRWNGVVPKIDPKKLFEQHSDLLGKPCDCGKFLYNSRDCGCAEKEREIWLQENNDYVG